MGLSFHQGLLQNPAGGPSDAAYLPGPYMHLVALGRGCSYGTFFQKKMEATWKNLNFQKSGDYSNRKQVEIFLEQVIRRSRKQGSLFSLQEKEELQV